MIDAYAHPTFVAAHVEHAVGDDLAQFGIREVVNIHAFRLAFALRWYRSGEDVERRMSVLSTYLGHVHEHVHVADTYWYLSACPELMGLAVVRLEQCWGEQP